MGNDSRDCRLQLSIGARTESETWTGKTRHAGSTGPGKTRQSAFARQPGGTRAQIGPLPAAICLRGPARSDSPSGCKDLSRQNGWLQPVERPERAGPYRGAVGRLRRSIRSSKMPGVIGCRRAGLLGQERVVPHQRVGWLAGHRTGPRYKYGCPSPLPEAQPALFLHSTAKQTQASSQTSTRQPPARQALDSLQPDKHSIAP